MATGPEHYTEAERLLGAVDDWDSTDPKHHPIIAEFIAQAQVHATLALAAASALNDMPSGVPGADWNAWLQAAGTGQQ